MVEPAFCICLLVSLQGESAIEKRNQRRKGVGNQALHREPL